MLLCYVGWAPNLFRFFIELLADLLLGLLVEPGGVLVARARRDPSNHRLAVLRQVQLQLLLVLMLGLVLRQLWL